MLCAHCATPVPDTARFCHNCGSNVSDAEGQAAATAAMTPSGTEKMEQLLREDLAGEFELGPLLGKGGMAMVYLATESLLARKVAIKVLPPELTFGHGVERFMREAKTAAALDHSNIIPIYRIASGGQLFWYAMKYLEGESLEELLKRKQVLTVKETVDLLAQVADALDYAHEHQVIHRDMKPANVMLDARQRVTVTDFGIAKALTEGTLTASGSVVGTPYYMSPEQAMGKPVTGASDQYSMGVMAYRMLSGHVPFDGDSAIDILHKHCRYRAAPLDSLSEGMPHHVALAVHKAIEKAPDHRFTSCRAFLEGMRAMTPELAEYRTSSGDATVVADSADRGRSISRISTEVVETPPSLKRLAAAQEKARARPAPPKGKGKALAVASVAVLLAAVGWALTLGPFSLLPDSGGTSPTAAQPEPAAPGAPGGGQPAAPPAATPAAAPAPAEPETGQILVTNLPASGATVVVDGRVAGAQTEVPPGEHEVLVSVQGFAEFRQRVTVAAGVVSTVPFVGRTVSAPREAQGRPATPPGPARNPVREPQPAPVAPSPPPSQPAAPVTGLLRIVVNAVAEIILDGRSLGTVRRVPGVEVLPASHQLQFRADGFVPKDTTVFVAAGDTVVVRIELERNP